MFATLTRAAGIFFCLLHALWEKNMFLPLVCVFWSIFGQYLSMFVRSYLQEDYFADVKRSELILDSRDIQSGKPDYMQMPY